MFLPQPGLKPTKQVHLHTKWRSVVLYLFKDELCPLPPNHFIRMVIKRGKPRKQKKDKMVTNDQTINTQTNNASIITTKISKPKEHETQTVVVKAVIVDADPRLIASDEEDSNYIYPNYNGGSKNELEKRITRSRRGKFLLLPKPKAVTNEAQNNKKL